MINNSTFNHKYLDKLKVSTSEYALDLVNDTQTEPAHTRLTVLFKVSQFLDSCQGKRVIHSNVPPPSSNPSNLNTQPAPSGPELVDAVASTEVSDGGDEIGTTGLATEMSEL